MAAKDEQLQDGVVQKIFGALRKYWGLMLVITLVAALAGVVYANIIKPTYTASCKTIYKAEFTPEASYSNVTLTKSYLPTFVDFCDEGCVLERANFYYQQFIDSGEKDVEKFVADIKTLAENGNDPYQGANTYRNEDIIVQNVSVTSAGGADDNFAVYVKYTDEVGAIAKNKAKIIILSIGLEANVKSPTTPDYSKYFGNAKIYINDISEQTAISGFVNKTRIVMIFGLIGIAVSCVVVYLINILNRSVRTREEIERITGTTLLAYIADQGD